MAKKGSLFLVNAVVLSLLGGVALVTVTCIRFNICYFRCEQSRQSETVSTTPTLILTNLEVGACIFTGSVDKPQFS